MPFRKFLDLSTAHLSPAARDILDAQGDIDGVPVLSVDPHGGPAGEYGWWLWAGTERKDKIMRDVPGELIRVMDYAVANGCDWICFDRDGDEHSDLPTWDW